MNSSTCSVRYCTAFIIDLKKIWKKKRQDSTIRINILYLVKLVISSHLISSHLISSHLISSHLISSHLTSSHLISLVSSRLISSHLILPFYIRRYFPFFKKIACGISAIKRIRHFAPCETLLTIYNALVQTHFNYCSVVWGNCNIGLSQKLQNRAARIITFSNYDCAWTDKLFRSLIWNKLNHQRMINKSILMYKVLNNETPKYLIKFAVY